MCKESQMLPVIGNETFMSVCRYYFLNAKYLNHVFQQHCKVLLACDEKYRE